MSVSAPSPSARRAAPAPAPWKSTCGATVVWARHDMAQPGDSRDVSGGSGRLQQLLLLSPSTGTEQIAGRTAARIPCYSLGACYCFILLLLQLLFHLLCMRGGCQQQRRPREA